MRQQKYGERLARLRAVTYKRRDSWWTVLLVDPVAIHLVRLADVLRFITPNQITVLAFLVGLGAAGAFLAGSAGWLAVGAALYHLAFVLDCVDGKLARWQGRGSVIGGWLDFGLDQIRLVVCTVTLCAGQYQHTGQGEFLLLAAVVVALDMFRYLNGSLMEHALLVLRDGPAGALRPANVGDGPVDPVDLSPGPAAAGRLRGWLDRRRIRLNGYGGIEFQMAVLIVAPVAGVVADQVSADLGRTVLTVIVGACALMVLAEAAQIVRFIRSALPLERARTALAQRPGEMSGEDVPVQRPAIAGKTDRPPR